MTSDIVETKYNDDFGKFINVMFRRENSTTLPSLRSSFLEINRWEGTQRSLSYWLFHCITFKEVELFRHLSKFIDSTVWEKGLPPDRNFNHPLLHYSACPSHFSEEIFWLIWNHPAYKPFVDIKEYMDEYDWTASGFVAMHFNRYDISFQNKLTEQIGIKEPSSIKTYKTAFSIVGEKFPKDYLVSPAK